MEQERHLQELLGTDKKNPSFTIYRDKSDGCLHVYFGASLYERIKGGPQCCEYRVMLGRLYNAGVKVAALEKAFEVGGKTLKRIGKALQGGDSDELVRVLAGRGHKRKLTAAIRGYMRMRFPRVYEADRYRYRQTLITEVKEVFGEEVSGETVRSICQELKREARKRATRCECSGESKRSQLEEVEVLPPESTHSGNVWAENNRKQSSDFCGLALREDREVARFHHHVGVLLFGGVLEEVCALNADYGWALKQWLALTLLGSVNIEQSKLVDFDDLDVILGRTLQCCRLQRKQLSAIGQTEVPTALLRLNAKLINVSEQGDFYYDPHAKAYTGKLTILKGWCGSKHFADKVLFMDMIHSSNGEPLYIDYQDNYYDLRERFCPVVDRFRQALSIDSSRVLTMVVDRGIYSLESFGKIIENQTLHLITWEKNYQAIEDDQWEPTGEFVMERPRNRADDLRKYRFVFMETQWKRDGRMRLLRVKATNPEGMTIELGILSDDLQRPAEQIVRLMFRRWLQENDFKYLDKHFGINQITSYSSIPYKMLQDKIEDKQIKSGECKAMERERQEIKQDLKTLLLQEHEHPDKDSPRHQRIAEADKRLKGVQAQLDKTEKEVSKLETLIAHQFCRLNTANKQVMDALKLIARNAFYKQLEPFKRLYDNFRDDHVLFRNLTRAHGLLVTKADGTIEVLLFPTAHHSPALRKIVETVLDEFNQLHPKMPDGSLRSIAFRLGQKEGLKLAISNQENTAEY